MVTNDPGVREMMAASDTPPRAPVRGELQRPERNDRAGGISVLVIFADAIYARGLQASVAELPDVRSVDCAVGPAPSIPDRKLGAADVVLLDCELPDAPDLARRIAQTSSARVLLCARDTSSSGLTAALGSASGLLPADSLTPGVVTAAIRAMSQGVGVLEIALLRDLCRTHAANRGAAEGDASDLRERLTSREHAVLALVAEGVPSREIADRLAYSERTIKNVIHDVITKLGARSRSHAVAMAVRERII